MAEEAPKDRQIRHCVDCGQEYPYDYQNKKGSTTRHCAPCAKRNAKEETKRLMLNAAGGGCKNCGYSKCLAAITFYDPVARLVPPPEPKNREEKIEWARARIPLCLNCQKEFENKFIFLSMQDAKARPPRCFFYTDVAQVIGKPEEKFTLAPLDPDAPKYADVEVTKAEPNITREVEGVVGEKEKARR